jgi:peptidoglycan/LPS O-acetylase OafA/YrhL
MAAKQRSYFEFIDGLRCLAVILVILFHLRTYLFKGGFVGVDVFFVISGFLITQICVSSSFSYRSFYISRSRRILPAYYFLLVSSWCVAYFVLLPQDMLQFTNTLLFSSIFLQNFFFWKIEDYFWIGYTNPLLHTWSLAVEWQFYMVLPLLIAPLRENRRLLILAILATFFVSLVISSVGAYFYTTPTFFLMPSRVWEFLLGGLLVVFRFTRPIPRLLNDGLSCLGIILIVATSHAFDNTTIFPGLSATVPCIGAALFIFSGIDNRSSFLTRLFSIQPVSMIGKASYSIYLFHWPLVVFTNYFFVSKLPRPVALLVLAGSILLGVASWWFVERPFRSVETVSLRAASRALVAAVVSVIALGTLGYATDGLTWRFSTQVLNLALKSEDGGQYYPCLNTIDHGLDGFCQFGASNSSPSFVLWGDSFADSLLEGLSLEAKASGVSGLFIGTGGCPPLFDFPSVFRPRAPQCKLIHSHMHDLVVNNRIKKLIIAGAWYFYAGYDRALFLSSVERTFSVLKDAGVETAVIGIVPGAQDSVPAAMAKERAFGFKFPVNISHATLEDMQTIDDRLKGKADQFGFSFVRLTSILCAVECVSSIDGEPLYIDGGHFSVFGSQMVVKEAVRRGSLSLMP